MEFADSPRAYFVREGEDSFRPTSHVGGGWNTREQHIAPSIGLLAHEIERDRDARRGDGLQLSRLSVDIYGVVPIEPVTVAVRVLRPGRTIELVEAQLGYAGRTIATARAWLTQRFDTAAHAGSGFAPIDPPDACAPWDPTTAWPGGFIQSLEARRREREPGHALVWLRTDVSLVHDETVSPRARALALVDAANGMTPRASTDRVMFPNLDLTAHLVREPVGEWTGFDTRVTFGPTGVGLTHSILHDEHGPLGAVAQSLTIRPRD
jgi:acyl-CoA thioesterase